MTTETETPYVRQSYAVWELTLKCNLRCTHCGSRAGTERADELSLAEALDLVEQLYELGITEVTLEGGEAFLRPDWLVVAKAISERGMRCSMATGGYGISRELVRRMKEAGVGPVSVSIDGMEAAHDRLRGRGGSWKMALRTMGHLRDGGIGFGCNTQINRLSAPDLPQLYEELLAVGAAAWQLQLTNPLGNAAEAVNVLLQPCELLDLFPVLARVAERAIADGMVIQCGNNLGYYGPYEHLIRAGGSRAGVVWLGCQAGLAVLGIHADGSIKACPTLPASYVGGNIRERRLREIVDRPQLTFNMEAGTAAATRELWDFCRSCAYAKLCRSGCTVSAHTLFGRRGNNPYCHHRALALASEGIRERVVPQTPAPGKPFDHGTWALVKEPLDAPWPESDPDHFTSARVRWTEAFCQAAAAR